MLVEKASNPPCLVSIAIPTFDRLDYLKEAVASALAQTYKNVEVLIGDDGSTEEIRVWGEEMARQNTRVRYQRNGRNLGLAANWNILADSARGEFLAIIGDDDRLLPEFVEKLIDVIQPSAHVAFSNHYLIDLNGIRQEGLSLRWTRRYHRDLLASGLVTSPTECVWRNSVPMSAALLRTRDIQRLRFKENLNTPEIELFARLAQEKASFAFTPEYLSEYRTHSQSATTAGLASEELVEYLTPIPVSADLERYKRDFMADLLVNAVSRCLQQNQRERARHLLRHKYYPHWKARDRQAAKGNSRQRIAADQPNYFLTKSNPTLTAHAQKICATLPISIGCRAYRLMQRIKRTVLSGTHNQ